MTERKSFTPGKGALATLVLVAMLNCMGGAAVAPALPVISQAFPETSETVISFIITLPSLAVAISGFFVGAIADRFGKARTLLISLVLFTITGLSALVLPNVETILVSRFLMGVSISGIATSSTALVTEYYDASMRAKIYGWQNASMGLSVLVLETTGGFLALWGWRVPFFVYVIGIPLIVLVALFVREAVHEPAQDRATNEGQASPASESGVKVRTVPAPAKVVAVGVVLAICVAVAFLSQTLSFLVPSKMPYLVTEFGANSAVSGIFLGVFGVANIVASLACVHLLRRFKRSTLTIGCFAFMGCACLLMALSTSIWPVLVAVAFMGLGVGSVSPMFMSWLGAHSTPENSGKHMGTYGAACNLGQFACSLLSGAAIALSGPSHAIFFVGIFIGVAFIVATIALRKTIDSE